jgi:DNA-binding transcriptional MerR regulator/predicted transcriptional regulator YdeE
MLTIGAFARLAQVSPRMLRHYDDIGLLSPDRVEPATGYRYYAVRQLARLHRLVALRDLGFTLEQIGPFLDEELTVDELRGMLRMRRAQIEDTVEEEQARLRRVEAHLRALEGTNTMHVQDIVLKDTHPMRIAAAIATVVGYGNEVMDPVFARLKPQVLAELDRAAVRPGICVAHYEAYADDGAVVVHIGFEIGDQELADTEHVRTVELPVTRVAAVTHHGSMKDFEPTYVGLVRWIEDSGLRMTGPSRELYHEWHAGDLTRNVTELQMPIGEQ